MDAQQLEQALGLVGRIKNTEIEIHQLRDRLAKDDPGKQVLWEVCLDLVNAQAGLLRIVRAELYPPD